MLQAYAEKLVVCRNAVDVRTAAVGLIFDAHQANAIVAEGQADLVALARGMLDDPNWAQHAKAVLEPDRVGDETWPTPVGAAVMGLRVRQRRIPLTRP